MGMRYRTLGRTDLQVSEVGLGLEYLNGQPADTVKAVLNAAIEGGINYFDVIFAFDEYLDNLAQVLVSNRDDIFVTAHLGSGEKDGQYAKTRAISRSIEYFERVLRKLETDHVDVLFLHNCDSAKDYQTLCKLNGILETALRLRDEGKARYIGFSGHTPKTAKKAVESGHVDVLMFPINLAGHGSEEARSLLQACAAHGVGAVSMKVYAGGKLLRDESTLEIGKYLAGGGKRRLRKVQPVTTTHCIAYALSQPAVATVVPGCSEVEHVHQALAYLDASEAERDFAPVLSGFQTAPEGECVYCNHCLPCPAHIDIGATMRLLDLAQLGDADAAGAYAALPTDASDCQQCGVCEERCPFGVPVMARMAEAVVQFQG